MACFVFVPLLSFLYTMIQWSDLVHSIFLVNLEVGSIVTKGQFVFFDVLVEKVTPCKEYDIVSALFGYCCCSLGFFLLLNTAERHRI